MKYLTYKGSFNVRIPAELHQQAALLAQEGETFLNNFVAEAIRQKVSKELSS
ncbi:MAG: YlcI/YnfO family protein [Mongoliitalea sp.]